MKTAFLIAGALLVILGSGPFLLPYFLSPSFLPDLRYQYYMGDTHHFSAPGETWRYPDPPLELSKGDALEVSTTYKVWGNITSYIVSGAGTQYGFQLAAFYPIQTDDLYQVYVIYEPVLDMPQSGYDVPLNVTVRHNSPIFLLQVIGLLLILAGAFLIVISFGTTRDKIMKESDMWQQKPTDKGVLP